MDAADKSLKFFYANGVELGMSQYDFNFKFLRQSASQNRTVQGQGLITASNVPYAIVDEFTVAVSPPQAKALLAATFLAVRDYEKKFGRITVDKDVQAHFDATVGPLFSK